MKTTEVVIDTKEWCEDVERPEKYGAYRKKIIDRLATFEYMCDGNLGRIKVVKHRIGMTSDTVRRIHRAQYRAAPADRQFKKARSTRLSHRAS